MSDILNKTTLVLNRNWQAINIAPRRTFCQMATNGHRVDIEGESHI
jgi:hypothetical protein